MKTVKCPSCDCDLTTKYAKAYAGYDIDGITITEMADGEIKVSVKCPNCGLNFEFYDYRDVTIRK